MLNNLTEFILSTVCMLFASILLIRAWMYHVRIHPFNPMFQMVLQYTDRFLIPIKKLIPNSKKNDWASILLAWILAFLFLFLNLVLYSRGNLSFTTLFLLPLQALLILISWALTLALWVCILQAAISWINPLSPHAPVLKSMTDPILSPIRRYLPNSRFDFSPLILIFAIQILQILLTGFIGQH